MLCQPFQGSQEAFIERFQCVRDSAKHTAFLITLNPHNARVYNIVIVIFTDKETEAHVG